VSGIKASKNFIFEVSSDKKQKKPIWKVWSLRKIRAMAQLHEAEANLSIKTDDFTRKWKAIVAQDAHAPTISEVAPDGSGSLTSSGMELRSLSALSSTSRDQGTPVLSLKSLPSAVHIGPAHNIPEYHKSALFARDDILCAIDHLAQPKKSQVVRSTPCIGLFGMSGVGKTEIALQYARRCVDHASHKYVFILRASSLESLHEDFTAIERLLPDSEIDIAPLSAPRTTTAIAQHVVNFLEHTSKYIVPCHKIT
jgi:hypothetical protein